MGIDEVDRLDRKVSRGDWSNVTLTTAGASAGRKGEQTHDASQSADAVYGERRVGMKGLQVNGIKQYVRSV